MADDDKSSTTALATPEDSSFFSNILTPGSSLNPTFLLIVDVALGLLLLVLLALFILTRGSLHFLFLMVIEGCLWASIKWFVNELQQAPPAQEQTTDANGVSHAGTKSKDE